MKNALLCLCLLSSLLARSQYYYNDIIGARELGEKMKVFMANKVRTVTATGYDAQGSRTSDFTEIQEVNTSSNTIKISTRQGMSVTRQYYHFDAQYRLLTIVDSSGTVKSTSTYNYDNSNHVLSILTVAKDSLNDFNDNELHLYSYSAAGLPEKMLKIINDKDSTEYRFTSDEKGNIGDEQLFRRNVGLDRLYYYYDDEHHLTDIVRYDKKLKRLLPDFMFEYDDNGRVIQKITTLSTASKNYLIWRYVFNEKGLKTKEALFNKQKELTGKIEYAYTLYP